jgi:hypothetical protein
MPNPPMKNLSERDPYCLGIVDFSCLHIYTLEGIRRRTMPVVTRKMVFRPNRMQFGQN